MFKDRNHMIISRDAGKLFDKVQHPFIVKFWKKRIKGNRGNIIKAICDTPVVSIITWGNGRTSFKIRNRT